MSCQVTAATKTTIATMMGICICAWNSCFYFYIGTLTFYKNANNQCAYVEAKQQWERQTQRTNIKIVMSGDGGDENNNCHNDGNLYLCKNYFFGTLTFHKNANSRCAYVEAKKQWKRQTQTTNNKIFMQDDDGDEQLSLQTMPINICTRRTLMVVPHWHIDFFKNTTVNVRMRSHNKDGNDRIRRQTTKSSCKTTTAMKNCRYRRCQSASVHVELSWLFHIGT